MAKGSTKKAPQKGQKTITSFFGGDKKPSTSTKGKGKPRVSKVQDASSGAEDEEAPEEDEYQDNGEEAEDEEGIEDEEETSDKVADTPATKRTKNVSIASSELPPIHHIPTIFSDLVGRFPQIKSVTQQLQGRKLRVATMCSGTESPLLALDLICRSISELYDLKLEVEHVFSCEIEPFKQAYIERNFKPPLLFRDVCELGETHATTAYGALMPVPGDVDLLVAGTSCVDYSNLNNVKQDIDAKGESGRTFRGMMSWVRNHRPPLVILENVCSAPWDRVVQEFEKIGYSAINDRVDTKNYYIPHTRTRGYLLAVDKKRSDMPAQWKKMVRELQRPASSSLDAFLLPSDDPRIHQAREKLVSENFNALDRRTGRTDWTRCESRHLRARDEEELGVKRPLTSWEDGGFCKLLDFAWNDWGVGQVERVWDLMDITLLRSAKEGVDPSYKTLVWNLSQNVDRTIGSSKLGICPCLTPSMIPYITNRGGPMVGLEALSMQGLPVDELLLTRESEDNLADLAGNAMSSTVVGTGILAALVVGKSMLKAGNDKSTYESRMKSEPDVDDEMENEAMAVDTTEERDTPIEEHISGEQQLVERPLDLSSTSAVPLADLLVAAEQSARLCQCEGRKGMTDRPLNRCQDCGSSACSKCGGRPEHNYQPIDVVTRPRLSPSSFARTLKDTLPMCLNISNVNREHLNALRTQSGAKISESLWSKWTTAVLRATSQELRFVEPKRQEIWVATYHSSSAYLELSLHPQQPEWRFYAKTEDSEPANSELRKVLQLPVGRFICSTGLFEGRWDFALPCTTTVPITITGTDLVPAWEARLGLVGDAYRDKKVHSKLDIAVPEEHVKVFDRDVSGSYVLLDKCGTANSALHKKVPDARDATLPPLFFLLDPTRCGEAKDDSFVFSISMRRYEYGETRPIVCRLSAKWRQSDVSGSQTINCHIPCTWVESRQVRMTSSMGKDARFAVPGQDLQVSIADNACQSANALLVCRVPIHGEPGEEWARDTWKEVDKVHERSVFKSLAWLIERIRNVGDNFTQWQHAGEDIHSHANCERCAPSQPHLRWTKIKNRIVALEDPVQAGEYERSLKRRPAPFVTQLKLEAGGLGVVRIGVNVVSLMHRAMSRLPSERRTSDVTLSWRLNTDFTPAAKIQFPKFSLSSNRQDPEHEQPPSFKSDKPLRPEQLRSLTWMLAQEKIGAPPFVEEEISEAILEPLGWRAEGRAERPVRIRGGVLADEVGYGKTAITLGLIDCAYKDVKKEFPKIENMKGKIAVKATLVIVPPHLTLQWENEVRKFTGKHFKVLRLSTATNLNTMSIEDVQEADIVIVASNLFRSTVYLANLEAFAAAGSLPAQDGRYFNARLDSTLDSLRQQVDLLRDQGAMPVHEKIKEGRKIDDDETHFVPTKRLKGKSYRDAAEVIETTKPAKGTKQPTTEVKKPKATTTTAASSRGPRTGLIAEVVVPRYKRSSPESSIPSVASSPAEIPPSSATEASDTDAADSDVVRPRRRTIKKTPIVISDDEDEDEGQKSDADFELASDDEEPKTKAKPKKAFYAKSRKVAPQSSDYEDEAVESDGDASEPSAVSSDDDSPKASKGKAKAKAKPNGTKKAPKTSDDESMDVDEPEPSHGKVKKPVKKRKAEDDDKRPAKKQKRREDSDPWKLGSNAVKRDWTQMQAPPLEMFHFARKVIDEYTYLDGKILSMVTRITAERHWVLSGTPPIHDFAALKTISAFLNLHLGIDDDGEGQSVQVKKRRREQTAVEKFHSFREVHSLEWHAHRHQLGQSFLDRFVRQNVAEIDEIPFTQHLEKVNLPAAERAIYLELEHHLRALDMTVKRGKKSESDREKRLAQALGESSTAEEALLKRCSHFDLDTSDKENAMKACEVIVKERTKQLENCKAELLKKLTDAVKQEKKIGAAGGDSLFQEYVRSARGEGVGDKEASIIVRELLDEAKAKPLASLTNQSSKKGQEDVSTAVKDMIWALRELTHELRRLTKELTGRVRSLRYFTVVRDLQKQKDTPPVVACPSCGRDEVPLDEIAVLSSCGHTGCWKCVKECADKEECVYAASGDCKAAARVLNIVKGDTLGVDDVERDGRGRHFGMKLEKVIQLIKKRIEPKGERVLIFVQFPDLMKKVAEALTANKIKFLEIRGTASQKSKNLDKFQQDGPERVLLLNVMDESASGANLTGANHAIFLSPLLTPSQEIYEACETQAVGRIRRYGQKKHVHIWRFLSMNTIDVEIYEQRTKTKV